MPDSKKLYVSPGIESERVDPPEAWACDIFNAAGSAGTWTGSILSLTSPSSITC